jgi:hypothetical protein
MVVLSGTALLLESELFLTSDERQPDLAKAEGIKVALSQPTHKAQSRKNGPASSGLRGDYR